MSTEKSVPTTGNKFDAATLKVSVAIGTVDLFTQYVEGIADVNGQVTVTRATVDALYGAIYHLRDAMDLFAQIPLTELQS